MRTWTATDACGNQSSDTQTINVGDNTPPALAGVPTDITVECDDIPGAPVVTATDNCDDNVNVELDAVISDGPCEFTFVMTRTFTATDACGNVATASYVITVMDTTPPVLSGVPADINAECDDNITLATPQVTASDNCDQNVHIEFTEEEFDNDCEGSRRIVRTWVATDNCGNTDTAQQTVQIGDGTPPTFSNVPADMTLDCDELVTSAQPVATDNCDDDVTVEMIEDTTTGACAGSFILHRTWIATDDCGNSTSVSQNITVEDNTPPVLSGVPGDVIASCDDVVDPGTLNVTATDDCDQNVDVTLEETRTETGCADSYELVRTWTATDDCGNVATATQTVTVGDVQDPTLVGVPDDVTVECDQVPAAANVTATDDCDEFVDVTMEEVRMDGNCADEYFLTRTWTATDDCGNVSTASHRISVVDTTDPVLAGVPGDVTINLNNTGSTIPDVANVTATDNCDNDVTVTMEENRTEGCTYTITRTWTATDNCGNNVSASQVITVIDEFTVTIAPAGAEICSGAPLNLTASPNDASFNYSWTSSAGNFDNTSSATPVYTMGTPGAYTITVSIVDPATGCEGSASITVVVLEAPTVSAGNNGPLCIGQTLELTSDAGAVSYQWSGPEGFTSNLQNPTLPNVTAGSQGQYTVVIDFGNGCIGTGSTLVEVNESLVVDVTNNGPVCEGEEIELFVSGGATFSWSGPNGFTATTQTVNIPNASLADHEGIYSVTVTSGTGCETVASTEVIIERFPLASASSNSPVCAGGTLELVAEGGVSYQWTGPNGFASTLRDPVINNLDLVAGDYTYTVIVSSAAGCTAETTVDVTVIGDLTIDITGETDICENETLTLTASGAVEYQWAGPNGFTATGATITINDASMAASGTYSVLATSADRCEASASIDVNILDCGCEADAWVEFTRAENCDDENGIAVLAPSNYLYDWSDGGVGSVREDLADGFYTVTVTDPEGCVSILEVTIEETGNCEACTDPVVNNTVIQQASCGESNGAAVIMIAGDPADYTYDWTPNIGTSNVIGNERMDLTAGMYEVLITDSENPDCFTKITFSIANEDGPQVDDIFTTDATCGAANGTATILPADYMYMWLADDVVGNTRTDLVPGAYEVAVMDLNRPECPTIITVVIGDVNDLVASAIVNTLPDCNGSNGSVTIEVTSGGTGNYTYVWSDGGTGMTRTDLVPGMYVVLVSDEASGCSSEIMFMLMSDVPLATVTVNDGTLSCAGNNDGFVDFSVELADGFAEPFTEVIMDDQGFTYSNGNLPAGDFCIVIFDANQCLAGQGCFTISQPEPITFDIVVNNMTCTNGGSISLTANGGNGSFTYNWADLPGTSNIEDRTELQPGAYSVTITDGEGCTSEMNNIVIEDDCTPGCIAPAVAANVTPSECGGFTGAIELIVPDDREYAFNWDPAVGINNSAAGLGAGAYSVTVSVVGDPDCNTELMVMVPNADGPAITAATTAATCDEGGSASLSPADLNYQWSDGGSGAERTNLMPGTYAVTGTDLNTNCENVLQVVIENGCASGCANPPVLTFEVNDANCNENDGNITLAVDGTGMYMYTWTNDISNGPTATGLAAGAYGVTVVDMDNPDCRADAMIVVGNIGAPEPVIVSSSAASCDQADGTAVIEPADLTYTWSDNGEGNVRDDLEAGEFMITATDANGCSAIISLTIGDGCAGCVAPVVDVMITEATCGNADGVITLNTTGNVTYTWNPEVSNTNIAEGLMAGIYQVIVTDANDAECNTVLEIAVGNSDGPVAEITGVSAADCDVDGTATLSPDTFTYTWSDNGTGAVRDDLPAGTYMVTVSDGSGCDDIISVVIPDNCDPTMCVPPVFDATVIEATCGNFDGAIVLAVDREANFTWSPELPDTNVVDSLAAGVYAVTIADANDPQCTTTATFTVTNSDGPAATIAALSAADCENGGSVTLTPDTLNYAWSDNGTGAVRDDLPAGTYTVTVSDGSGCENTFVVTIEDNCDPSTCDEPVVNVQSTDTSCGNADGSITLNVEGDVTYTWTPAVSETAEATGLAAQLYTIVVARADDAQCNTTVSVVIGNSDGPQAAAQTTSADCNTLGTATISPDSLTYTWEDGTIASFRDDLAGGFYVVTVSDGTECENVISLVIEDVCDPTDPGCAADAGSLDIDLSPICLADSTVTITATPLGNMIVPDGFEVLYVLTDADNGFVILDAGVSPEFTVDQLGTYRLHTLVYDPNTLDLNVIEIGVTTGFDVDALLIQGGGEICASLDLLGATTLVYDCGICEARAGSLTLDSDPIVCIDSTVTSITISATPDGNQNVPENHEILYVLTTTGDFTYLDTNDTPAFDVSDLGLYTIHTLVYDTSLVDLDTLNLVSGTTDVFFLQSFLLQGGGTICGELDLAGAMVTVEECDIPTGGCDDIVSIDTEALIAENCEEGALFCLEIDPLSLDDFEIMDNGTIITNFEGCDFDSTYSYSYMSLVDAGLNGPYFVDNWNVDDTTFTGEIADIFALVDSMNVWDPNGEWVLDTVDLTLIGGVVGTDYGMMTITQIASNLSADLVMSGMMVPNGIGILLEEGMHTIEIVRTIDGCDDVVVIEVTCQDPMPEPMSGDTIELEIVLADMDTICINTDSLAGIDTIFNACADMSEGNVDFEIVDSTTCIAMSADMLGVDTACIVICDTLGVCDTTTLIVTVIDDIDPGMQSDTVFVTIEEGMDSLYCDSAWIAADTIYNACPEQSGDNAAFMIDPDTNCIAIIGLTEGVDTACIVVCDTMGMCDTTIFVATIVPEGSLLPPVAVNDDTMTIINTPITMNVMINDTLNAEEGTIEILDQPLNGMAEVTDDGEIIYTPDPGFCGAVDSFTYVLTTINGSDTATVFVNVLCEELRVFTGFSPNGDGVNDIFTILGIERFPNAKVYVYNRWGNLIYLREGGYQNEEGIAFDGTWNGETLPDGTYFYMIDTNEGDKLSGWVQIHLSLIHI